MDVDKVKKRVLWTREATRDLKKLLEDRLSIKEISLMLGRTEKSIRRKCERLSLSSSTTYTKTED